MQLKTVKQIRKVEQIVDSIKENLEFDSEYGVHPAKLERINDLLTQDRADIRAVLKEGVEKTVGAREAWEGSYDPMEYQNGYARAKKDILTLIDTLLPGDVSN